MTGVWMIRGIGTDIVDVSRMRRAVGRWGDRFLKKVFTDGEIAHCMTRKDPFPSLAVRFAAKEAFIKAFSTEVGRRVLPVSVLRDIEVVNAPSGKPSLIVHGRLSAVCAGTVIHLTLAHETTYAVATVVLEKKEE